jgi:hypothetical protein
MDKLKVTSYAPYERGFFDQKPERIKTVSESYYTDLPDPVSDPIVTNNISNQEFDYTYNGDALDFEDIEADDLFYKDE